MSQGGSGTHVVSMAASDKRTGSPNGLSGHVIYLRWMFIQYVLKEEQNVYILESM